MNNHFLIRSLSDKELAELPSTTLQGPYPGLKAFYTAEDGGCLVVMPTEVPLLRPGLSVVKIGDKYPILVPHQDGKPGHFADIRHTANQGKGRVDYTWWVSRITEDPYHVLLAWNGRDVPMPGGGGLLEIARG